MLPDLRIWLNHFEYHAQHPRRIPADLPDVLTGRERALIAGSIATFQLGEHSSGRTLSSAAHRFALRHDMPELTRIIELFIREERRHADLLREFMTDHCMRVKNHAPTDLAFRAIRRLAGFELYLHVLVTAELIGNVYYRALETTTGCQRLKILCRTLVADELAHIGFESELLRELRERRSPVPRALMRIAHRAFFTGVALTVWTTHHAVLRRVGYDASTFLRVCHAQYAFHLDLPRRPENAQISASPHSHRLTSAGCLAKGKVQPTPS
jgi:hypothetical protein